MKIEKNFFGEFIEECNDIIASNQSAGKATGGNEEFTRKFIESLYRARKEQLLERRAKGLCMPAKRYFELVQSGSELAERIGLDFLAETSGGEGIIVLTGGTFLLSKDETPELLESLAELVSASDRLDVVQAEKYGMKLSKAIFSFELDEDI